MSNITSTIISEDFYFKCTELTREYEKLSDRWSIDSQLLHIITEVCEIKDVLRNKKEKYDTNSKLTTKQKKGGT